MPSRLKSRERVRHSGLLASERSEEMSSKKPQILSSLARIFSAWCASSHENHLKIFFLKKGSYISPHNAHILTR